MQPYLYPQPPRSSNDLGQIPYFGNYPAKEETSIKSSRNVDYENFTTSPFRKQCPASEEPVTRQVTWLTETSLTAGIVTVSNVSDEHQKNVTLSAFKRETHREEAMSVSKNARPAIEVLEGVARNASLSFSRKSGMAHQHVFHVARTGICLAEKTPERLPRGHSLRTGGRASLREKSTSVEVLQGRA